MSKKKPKCATCTPNCIYFQQDVPRSQIESEKFEDGVKQRSVMRNCLYDNSQIKSWSHLCGRKQPCYIIKGVDTNGNEKEAKKN